MNPEDALQLVLTKLDECQIPYMITGSFASNMHGVPRATQDADVVIEADQGSLDRFLENLGAEFYASHEAAREALETQRMFNVVHLETGFKVDLIMRKSRPFSQIEFSRRQQVTYLGRSRWFATAEDVILAKLEWAKMGNTERQFTDAVNVAKIQGKGLDEAYLQKWAGKLEAEELLERLFRELG
jgi:hypothetical protein